MDAHVIFPSDVLNDEKNFYIIMPYGDDDLCNRLHEKAKFDENEARFWMDQLLTVSSKKMNVCLCVCLFVCLFILVVLIMAQCLNWLIVICTTLQFTQHSFKPIMSYFISFLLVCGDESASIA